MSFSFLSYVLYSISFLIVFLVALANITSFLETNTSNKIKATIKKSTNSVFSCFLIGVVFSAITSSSTAICAITLSLISACVISYKKGLIIIISSNIGTSFSSLLFTFNTTYIYPFLLFVGFILLLLKKRMAFLFIYLGLLFLSLDFLSFYLEQIFLKSNLSHYIYLLNNYPFLSFLISIPITALVASSSATIGIIQKLTDKGIYPFTSSIAFMLGANIGTTISGFLASITGSKNAKSAALVNFVFNLVGSLFFLLLLRPFTDFLCFVQDKLSLTKSVTLSFSHIIYNAICVFVFLCFYAKKEG